MFGIAYVDDRRPVRGVDVSDVGEAAVDHDLASPRTVEVGDLADSPGLAHGERIRGRIGGSCAGPAKLRRMNRRCALATLAAARAAETLRIATLTIDSGAACFYAQEEGFFARAGIDAQIQTVS